MKKKKHKGFHRPHQRFIISASLVFGALLIVYSAYFGPSLIEDNSRVWAVGQVVEDVSQAAATPSHVLIQVSEKRKIRVEFSCMSGEIDMKPGDTIEVLGFAVAYETISVCTNEKAYLKKIR